VAPHHLEILNSKLSKDWNTDTLVAWLGQKDLKSFIPAFRKHRIAGDVLFEMSRQDLVDMMNREQSLVYGDLIRLERAVKGYAQVHGSPVVQHVGGSPSQENQGMSQPGFFGLSLTGFVVAVLGMAFLISPDVRKVANIAVQVLSIQVWYLYRKMTASHRKTESRAKGGKADATKEAEDTAQSKAHQSNKCDAGASGMTGRWKCVQSNNFQNFLAVQGVNLLKRKLADSTPTTHIITAANDRFRLQIQSLVSFDATYVYGAEPIQTKISDDIFMDKAELLPDGAVRICKFHPKKNYEIVNERRLSEDGNSITLHMHCLLLDGSDKQEECTQIFRRVK